MYISQLPYGRCCHGNHEIKGDFCSFEYFHLLIIPNTPLWIFTLETPKKNCTHVPYNNKKQTMRYVEKRCIMGNL